MNAEILCIGTELLHGDIVNTNAATIAKELAKIGIDVHYQSVVGDNPARIRKAYELAFSRANVVISTGGLGPTQDDITKDILAEYFERPMVFDENSMEHVKKMYMRFRKDMPENNIRQAYFPEGAVILENPNGTANGCIVYEEKEDVKIGVLMPGPPYEMKPMLVDKVIPFLQKYSNQVVVAEKIIVMNVGESAAEMMAMDLIENQTNPTIATYAGNGKCMFRVTAKAENEEAGYKLIEPIKQELLKRFGENAYVSEDGSIESFVFKLLMEKNITVATAESCTGGLVASKIIDFPGSSAVFKEGFVTYSNEAKENTLGVSHDTLEKYGAVSSETASEMAKGAAEKAGADLGLSTTGIAGPDGGTKEKPVGLVYIGVYYKGKTYTKRLNNTGTRNTVRERSAVSVLDMARNIIMQENEMK